MAQVVSACIANERPLGLAKIKFQKSEVEGFALPLGDLPGDVLIDREIKIGPALN
jgi:hypothetical protein